MGYTLMVNGIPLTRWTVARGTFFRPPVSARSSLVESRGRHGVTSVGLPVFDEPQLTVKLAPLAGAGVSLDDELADLNMLLASPTLTVARVRGDGSATEAAARLVSITPEDEFIYDQWARVTVVIALPGVFLRDPTHTEVSVPVGQSTQAALAGSGPIADAVVRWEIPSVQMFSLADVTTGTGISVTPVNSGGTYIYVDVATMRSWRSTLAAAWTNTGTSSEDPGVDYPAAGPLQIWPAPVTSGGQMVGRSASLLASHACVVRARRAWL